MHTDGLDIILGFFEGFALIISPCILPILPIVLASSLAGSKKRPFGITLGFVMTFALVAFFSRQVAHLLECNLICVITLLYGILLSQYVAHKYHSSHYYLQQPLLAIMHEALLSTNAYAVDLYRKVNVLIG